MSASMYAHDTCSRYMYVQGIALCVYYIYMVFAMYMACAL